MPIVDPFDSRTTNTGIIDPFDAPKSAKIIDPFDTKEKPSFFKSALKAPIAGVGDAIEMYSRALRTTDPEGGWDVVRKVATKGVDLGKAISEKFPTENEDFGLVKRGVVGGIRSSVPSVTAGVPGAIIGAVGGIPGIVAGYAGSGAVITGAAEYDRFLELADQYGIPKDIARSGAIKSALVEGGIEGAANALDAILLKAGSPVVSGFKQFAKNALKVGGVESGTEAIQAALEAKIARDVGIPAPHPLEAAKESVIPALTMGSIIGAGGTMANKMLTKPPQAKQIKIPAIVDPFDVQVKPPQIQQTQKQEIVLPEGEKPFVPLKVYRGKEGNISTDFGLFGKGIYYTTDKEYASRYGEVTEHEIIIKNPVSPESAEYKQASDFAIQQALKNHIIGTEEQEDYMSNKKTEYLLSKGYDSVIVPKAGARGDEIVILKQPGKPQTPETHIMPSGEVMPGAEHKETIPASAITIGTKVRADKSPQIWTVTKAHESTPEELELGEQYFDIKNDKTGEIVENIQLKDIKPLKGKAPTGTADAGGYIPTQEQSQYAGAERQPTELPEVVELYNEISKGKYPAIERYMKNKLGYYSPKKGKIGLRQDLPIGERIELSPHIEGFRDLLSTVPDLSIHKGDIAIEPDTIAVSPRVYRQIAPEFENYMRENSGLTESEIDFRKDFNKKTRMYELRAYRKDKTLALKALSHEVFHYVDALPDHAKRGNVLGHIATLKRYLKHMLDTFPTSAEADINQTKIELRKQALGEAKGQPEFWKAANQRYKELLAQELSQREVITKQEIMAELKALTQKIKPFDDKRSPKFTAYRYSNKELYADAGGALLWNPKLLQETAPKFYKSFFAYLERKPEVKQAYDAIQNKLGMIPGLRRDVVIQDRIRRMKEGYGRGRKARKEMEERRKSSAETIVDSILNQAMDDEHANLKRIRSLEKKGGSDYEIGRKARLSIEELKMIDSKIENYLNHFTNEVDMEMHKNNISLDDMGVFAQASRVKEERGKLDIFNPGGETLESSQEMLAHLQQDWGQDKFTKVSELFDKFQELRQKYVIPALEESRRYDPELVEYTKNNLFYTRNSVVKYLTERFGGQITGTIYKQYGSLSEIESPIEATIIQDIMLIRAAKVNELKLDMVDVLRQTNELTLAEIDKSTKKWQPKPPPDQNNYGVFTVMRDGKPEHYYIDKQIVESFQFEPYRAKQISSIVHMISEPFRRLFVTRNPRWMFKNPIRDIKATIKQVPGIKLRNIPEFMLDYGRSVKEAFSDVFLGKRSEDISNLMEKSGIITGRYYDQDNFETKLEELQSQFSLEHHPKKVQGAWNRLKRVYQIIDRQFDKAGRVSDISTKIAGYKYLKKHSMKSEREIMHDVRTLVGTPNSRRQGRLHWLLNNIFMFSNIGKEGMRSTWESFRTKPTAYLWKTSALNILPLLTLLGAGAAGVEWVKKILEELSQYDLESKTIIPTPYTVNNKPVAIAIPEDYQGMVVRKLVFNILNKDVGGSLKALWDAKPYQWHPMIKIGNAMFQYYILGNNPKDTFRNRDIIPRDKFEVGGLTASKAIWKHVWNELGGSLFYRFPYDDVVEDFKSVETLKKTFPMNALGDFLIISNEGIKQSSYEIQDKLDQAYAKRRFDVKQEIKKSINSSDVRKTDKEILKELYIPLARKKLFDYKTTSPTEFINKYRRLESKKEDNPYLDSLENAQRNEVKEALLDEYSQKLSRKEMLQLLSTALKEKILTDEFTKKYLIKQKAKSSN